MVDSISHYEFEKTAVFQYLLESMPMEKKELYSLIKKAPYSYKEHFIEKRNGHGKRLISQPIQELKVLQKYLIETCLKDLPVHAVACAYQQGVSIKAHAVPHANHRYLLKLDFKDFFPSITGHALSAILKQYTNFEADDLALITRVLCKKDKDTKALCLSIGAPSSPFISNHFMYKFDLAIDNYCKVRGITYTRYADDLAFSTSHRFYLKTVLQQVQHILNEAPYSGLSLNAKKTLNISKKRQRSLVGLTLGNSGQVSIGRDKKRLLRAQMHYAVQGKLNQAELNRLKGQLAFVYSVDPGYVVHLCSRYGFQKIAEITLPVQANEINGCITAN